MTTTDRYDSLDGQVALVTGATRGSGEQTPAQLTEKGATVYAGARDTADISADDQLPGVRVVKAFNTMYWETLRDDPRPDAPLEERLALFLAGDDEEATSTVAGLIEDAGFAPVDTGPLREGGRLQEPGSAIYNEPLTKSEAEKRLQGLRE